jgi:D-proline reductase (dithiol) PrdB
VGLVAIACEAAGMATCCLSLRREATESVRPPRALFLRWPYGSPMGEPGHVAQQRRVLLDMLALVRDLRAPGQTVAPGYRWRREDYENLPERPLP